MKRGQTSGDIERTCLGDGCDAKVGRIGLCLACIDRHSSPERIAELRWAEALPSPAPHVDDDGMTDFGDVILLADADPFAGLMDGPAVMPIEREDEP